ncbi:MAG: hypothetical protein A2X36_05350 [Elusimicrobia bacterium GWA2_69_24]|nr:MAG: hypothetical protein A2X36_05350 [Elusimicrobia bacterium GWA2_69_24]HBL18745.1 hypothetical protein [Elusimicrobiota bacterium]
MLGKTDNQTGFFGDFLYDQVVPQGHFLRRMRELIDADRINEACRGLYSETGRPGWEPAILFRMLLLQTLLELPAREVEEQANLHLAFKWFIGLEANAKAPDANTLAAFKERLGPDRFGEMNAIILEKAREKGLLAEKVFIADTDKFKLQGETYRVRKERPRAKSPDASKSANRPFWERVSFFFRELIGGRP